MDSPFELMKEVPEPAGKKEVPHKGRLIFSGEGFSGAFDVAFHEAQTDPLLELEGEVVQLGPGGKEVEARRPYQYFEGGVQIQPSQITKVLRYRDGTTDPYADLPRTKTFNVSEQRPVAECNLDPTDPTLSYGTTVPIEDVSKYVPEKTIEVWDYAKGLKSLGDYLEQHKLALLYPFSFGRGRKIYTAIVAPVRIEGSLYLVKRLCTGQIIYRHPLQAGATAQTAKVVMAAIRIRNKQNQLGS